MHHTLHILHGRPWVAQRTVSKTISHERAVIELDALANGKPLEEVSDKMAMGELRDVLYEASSSILDHL